MKAFTIILFVAFLASPIHSEFTECAEFNRKVAEKMLKSYVLYSHQVNGKEGSFKLTSCQVELEGKIDLMSIRALINEKLECPYQFRYVSSGNQSLNYVTILNVDDIDPTPEECETYLSPAQQGETKPVEEEKEFPGLAEEIEKLEKIAREVEAGTKDAEADTLKKEAVETRSPDEEYDCGEASAAYYLTDALEQLGLDLEDLRSTSLLSCRRQTGETVTVDLAFGASEKESCEVRMVRQDKRGPIIAFAMKQLNCTRKLYGEFTAKRARLCSPSSLHLALQAFKELHSHRLAGKAYEENVKQCLEQAEDGTRIQLQLSFNGRPCDFVGYVNPKNWGYVVHNSCGGIQL